MYDIGWMKEVKGAKRIVQHGNYVVLIYLNCWFGLHQFFEIGFAKFHHNKNVVQFTDVDFNFVLIILSFFFWVLNLAVNIMSYFMS